MAWTDEYCVGLPRIDQQHKILLDCISLIQDAVSKRTTVSAIQAVLGQLENFARLHFAYEESSMRNYRYPGSEEHAEEHLQFMAALKDLQQESQLADTAHQLIILIENRLREHIMHSDRQFASWLGVAEERAEETCVLEAGRLSHGH